MNDLQIKAVGDKIKITRLTEPDSRDNNSSTWMLSIEEALYLIGPYKDETRGMRYPASQFLVEAIETAKHNAQDITRRRIDQLENELANLRKRLNP